jgi:hypothetical protein
VQESLVTGITDIPMTQSPINSFLLGLFPCALMVSTHPLQVDGPYYVGISGLSMSWLPRPLECRFLMTAMPTRSGSPTPVPLNGWFRLYWGFQLGKFPDPLTMGMPISRCTKMLMVLDPRHMSFCQRTVQIPSGFRDLRCPLL